MSSGPPCYCSRPSVHLVRNLATGAQRFVCEREECEWQAHCRLLDPSMYQAPGALLRAEGNDGFLPP